MLLDVELGAQGLLARFGSTPGGLGVRFDLPGGGDEPRFLVISRGEFEQLRLDLASAGLAAGERILHALLGADLYTIEVVLDTAPTDAGDAGDVPSIVKESIASVQAARSERPPPLLRLDRDPAAEAAVREICARLYTRIEDAITQKSSSAIGAMDRWVSRHQSDLTQQISRTTDSLLAPGNS